MTDDPFEHLPPKPGKLWGIPSPVSDDPRDYDMDLVRILQSWNTSEAPPWERDPPLCKPPGWQPK